MTDDNRDIRDIYDDVVDRQRGAEIKIKTTNGEMTSVRVTPLGFGVFFLAAKMPDTMATTPEELTEEHFAFMQDFVLMGTDLERHHFEIIPLEEMPYLIESVDAVNKGNEPPDRSDFDFTGREMGTEQFHVEEPADLFEFNDDGSVDLEDWR